jgi:hypothetical protein
VRAYSQKDPRWSDLEVGNSGMSMKQIGCYITSIAMLVGRDPREVLRIANNGSLTPEGLIDSNKMAQCLGMVYRKVLQQPPQGVICIGETDFYASKGYDQHFFVLLNDGTDNIADPLDGMVKKNPYPVVSYRLFLKEMS